MNWKLLVAAGALAGAALAARRRTQKAAADSELWSSATDPITPSAG
jgi:hypothetical protein